MENLSEHLTYREATYSQVAEMNQLPNEPDQEQLERMIILAERVFEPLRAGLDGRPIYLSSMFRSRDLNSTIMGASNSQHMANKGAAVDIDNDNNPQGPTNAEIFHYIKDYLGFDQLIWEYGDDENPGWVHVSYYEDKNRNQVLKCRNGKYYPWI